MPVAETEPERETLRPWAPVAVALREQVPPEHPPDALAVLVPRAVVAEPERSQAPAWAMAPRLTMVAMATDRAARFISLSFGPGRSRL